MRPLFPNLVKPPASFLLLYRKIFSPPLLLLRRWPDFSFFPSKTDDFVFCTGGVVFLLFPLHRSAVSPHVDEGQLFFFFRSGSRPPLPSQILTSPFPFSPSFPSDNRGPFSFFLLCTISASPFSFFPLETACGFLKRVSSLFCPCPPEERVLASPPSIVEVTPNGNRDPLPSFQQIALFFLPLAENRFLFPPDPRLFPKNDRPLPLLARIPASFLSSIRTSDPEPNFLGAFLRFSLLFSTQLAPLSPLPSPSAPGVI